MWIIAGLVICVLSLEVFFVAYVQSQIRQGVIAKNARTSALLMRDLRSPAYELMILVGIAIVIAILRLADWPEPTRSLAAIAAGLTSQVALWMLLHKQWGGPPNSSIRNSHN
jgi:hypothetical protein